MAEFLLELFSEEIPAGMQPKAESWMVENFTKALKEAKLEHSGLRSIRTPRRIALIASGLPDRQPDVSEERKGPATTAPAAALEGFLRSTGLTKEQLETRTIGKADYYFAVINQKGKTTAEALKAIVEKLLAELPWPKSMRWNDYDVNWARPLQNICCLLDSAVVPVEFAHLKANNQTFGHRWHAPAAITLKSPADYEPALEKAFVIADGTKREAAIKAGLEKAAKTAGATMMEDAALLAEVTGLVEWPVILQGSIDDAFMNLPPEVMRSEMRNHQKYFTLVKPDGTAAKHFLIVSNLIASDGGKAVIAGNERVLRARLSDGQFFYQQDQKQKLESWNEKLVSVVFHAKLGTVANKVSTIQKLAENLAAETGADAKQVGRAAALCKADLATGMVGEFPELQGIMGRYYALAQGETPEVANAIRDHYLPLGPNSPIPTAPVSIVLALADKLDTLGGLFSVGEIPTGSKDPFALRRAALGVIRIILENNLRIGLKHYLKGSAELMTFFFDRLRGVLKDKGMRHDVIEAVLSGSKDDDLLRLTRKIEALQHFMQSNDATALLTAYGRAANILAKSEANTAKSNVSTELLELSEEKALYEAMRSTSSAVEAHLAAEAYGEALASFAKLRQPVDAFFDKVTVNADDAKLRGNRLSLLSALVDNMQHIADFSQIQQAA